MEEFVEGGFWKGELYLDNGKKSYQALSLKSTGVLEAVSMIFMNKAVKAAHQKYKSIPGNLKGDGLYAPHFSLLPPHSIEVLRQGSEIRSIVGFLCCL